MKQEVCLSDLFSKHNLDESNSIMIDLLVCNFETFTESRVIKTPNSSFMVNTGIFYVMKL